MKKKKARSKDYDPKLKIEGTFEDVIRVSVQPEPKAITPPEKKDVKDAKKKKD